MIALGIDPGEHTGLAWVRSDGEVMYTAQFNHKPPDDVVDFCERVSREAISFSADVVVIECPVIYDKKPYRASDVLSLTLKAGIIAGVIRSETDRRIIFKTPGEWKGQVPKKIHNKRVVKTLTAIDMTFSDHVIDAAGLAWFGITGKKL